MASELILVKGKAHANVVKQSRAVRINTFPRFDRGILPTITMLRISSLREVTDNVTFEFGPRGGFFIKQQLSQFLANSSASYLILFQWNEGFRTYIILTAERWPPVGALCTACKTC